MISRDIGDLIISPKTIVSNDDYDIHSSKKHRLYGKKLKCALQVMEDNTKAFVIAINKGQTREDGRYHETMDREDD